MAEIDPGKLVALRPPSGGQPDDAAELALSAQPGEVSLGGAMVVIARADGGGSRLDLPDGPAPMQREVGAGRRRFRIAAGADK